MADMEILREWVSTLREDVETLKSIVDAGEANGEARKFAGAALNYLLTRMDLVPDWEDSIGVLDDVLVIRALAGQVAQVGVDDVVGTSTQVALGRLTNEADRAEAWLGTELWSKFSKHALRMVDKPVRGRSPDTLIGDEGARKAAWAELDDHIVQLPPATFKDPEAVSVKFKSYLEHKLK